MFGLFMENMTQNILKHLVIQNFLGKKHEMKHQYQNLQIK